MISSDGCVGIEGSICTGTKPATGAFDWRATFVDRDVDFRCAVRFLGGDFVARRFSSPRHQEN